MIEAFRVRALTWAADTVRTLLAQLRGDGDIAADAVEVVQPAGLRARPTVTSTLEALVVEMPNGDRVAAFLVDKARAEGTVEPEAGETQLHGLADPGARVRLRADGSVDLHSGVQIRLGEGASKKVARVGDTVRVTIPAGTTFTGTIAGSPPTAATFTTTAPVVCNGEIITGSDIVRAVD